VCIASFIERRCSTSLPRMLRTARWRREVGHKHMVPLTKVSGLLRIGEREFCFAKP
jgi:hypothetical protein